VFTLFGGGTANVNAGSLVVGGLTHGTATSIGNVNLSNGGSLTISDGLGATYAGAIGGAGSLTKTGAGTQTLTGVNGFSGATNINGGTLVLSGAGSISASPVITVSSGATLDVGGVSGGFTLAAGQTLRGGGTVTGAVRAASGATMAPGTPAGTDDLLVNGNLTLNSGSTLAERLNGNVAGTGYDQLVVTGTGTITLTGSTLRLTGSYAPLSTDVLTVIRNGPNIAVTGTFSNSAVPGDPLGRLDFGSYIANISYFGSGGTISGGHDVVVYNFVPVPEPGAILAIATVAGIAFAGIRRRVSGCVRC
jgi:autotransporter-associated beta strand protein